MKIPMLLTILLLTLSLATFAALVHTSSLENGLVVLQINTTQNQVTVTDNDPSRSAVFNVFDATGTEIVWSYTQPPNSANTIAIPAVDNNSNPINWQVGTITTKSGQQVQTIVSPPWQVTMQ